MLKLTTLLLLLSSSTDAAHLRGQQPIQTHGDHAPNEKEEFLECYVTEDDGISPPESPELVPKLSCHLEPTDGHAEASYDLVGNTDALFHGEDLSSGNIVLRYHASLAKDSAIEISNRTLEQLTIVRDRRRKLLASNGQVKVLVIRVSDDSSNDYRRKVTQSTTQMYWDVFGDENNLSKVYNHCSNGNLNMIPATGIDPQTGREVDRGVVTVVPDSNEDICNMTYKSAGNIALEALKNAQIDAQHKMIILPDCVNFQGAGAWGQTPGQLTWFPSRYASFPVTQVHEIGHNLGMRHSGKNGVSYADDTDSMGNKGSWSDIGSKMCFNGAKTWYFGWYSNHHKYVNPENWPFKGDLGTVTDAARFSSSENAVLHLKSGSASSLFVIFNRAEAFNQDVGDPDTVLITEQLYSYSISTWMAALKAGETYHHKNWNGSQNTLVIKNCGITYGDQTFDYNSVDRASIIAYVDGVTFASCPNESFQQGYTPAAPASVACTDTPNWYDSGGKDFDCAWYALDPFYCKGYGNHFSNFGQTANTACCICKNALN
jgi:hypothetical protein